MSQYLVKLVRDDAVSDLDNSVSYRALRDRELHVKELRKKLVEEAAEYLADPSIEELSDILEVVICLAEVDLHVGLPALHTVRELTRKNRGSFYVGTGMYISGDFNG